MEVKVKYFGVVAEKLNKEQENISIDVSTDIDLRKLFISLYPILEPITFKIAVDHVLMNFIQKGSAPSEIALLPPFAGG
ncbi:MAG: MoaD/ThiS family protein [Crocinitomicaceae bacterium]|nr:MoaD/ThiS family protein [Crocinitomicaceae bacterium]